MSSRARLFKELRDASKGSQSQEIGIRLTADERNVYSWQAFLQGPEDTPFAGGVFELAIRVPEKYPFAPPVVTFKTKIFHPNIHFKSGEICLDILKGEQWSPAWTLESVCQAIIVLMGTPAADSPLNCDAGNLLRAGDSRGYESLARMYTIDLAKGPISV